MSSDPATMWLGLNEVDRFQLSTAIVLKQLGEPSSFTGYVDHIHMHQALWVQFHGSHGIPPSSNTQLTKWLKANLFVGIKQLVRMVTRDHHFRSVHLFGSRQELKQHLRKGKNRMDRRDVKALKLDKLLVQL